MLNYTYVDSQIPLGYGLDYRVDLNKKSEKAVSQIYARMEDVSSNETALSDLVSNYYFPSSGVSCQIYSEDNTDTMNILVYYYPDATTELPQLETIDLSGNVAQDLSNNIFRISRIVANPQSGQLNNGNVFLHQSGNSNNVISCMRPNIGYSEDPYIYIPYNTTAYLIYQTINSNCNDTNNCEIYTDRYLSPLLPNYFYRVQQNCIRSNNIDENVNTAQGLPANTTYMIKCKRTGGANVKCRVLYDFVFFK